MIKSPPLCTDKKAMVSIWIIIGLIGAAVSVSALAAGFSVMGLGALFSGALLAVYAMASALEFAKFVLAAYLHQRWQKLNLIFRTYLLFSIVVLSLITSLGVFGFLSDAYQSSSALLDAENIKLGSLKNQEAQKKAEYDRLVKSVEEIPATRITKRLQLRAELEPAMNELQKEMSGIEKQVSAANLKILEVKQRVGPLIYIARAFDKDLDTVVKYLILVFVSVFDPLAICLVIATSEALTSRRQRGEEVVQSRTMETAASATYAAPTTSPVPEINTEGAEIISMRFADEKPEEPAVATADASKKDAV